MKTLIKNAKVLTMVDGPILKDCDVLIIDKKIAKLEKNIADKDIDNVIDATGCLLMPGFKNAHSHSAMTFSRSSSDNLPLQDWLHHCIFPMEDNLKPNDVYNLSKGSFLEYLTSGITATFDMYYAPIEIAKAAIDFNFRVVILGTTTSGRQSIDEMENAYKVINGMKNDLVKYRFGFHAEYTLSEEKLEGIKMLCKKYKEPIATHASETPSEVNGCKERHNGQTPTEFIYNNGLFEYGGTLFHNVAVSNKDIKIMKNNNVFAVTCPGSNSKLASGIAPISKLEKAGVNVAIGTDGPGSNNCLDMFKEMTLVFSLQKLKDKNAVTSSAYEILKMATVNGAHAMGLYNCDTIEIGKYADLILIDLLQPNMQPINDIISNVVYSGCKENIKMTMINGKIMYFDHKFYIDEDYKNIYAKQQEISDRLNKNNIYKVSNQ